MATSALFYNDTSPRNIYAYSRSTFGTWGTSPIMPVTWANANMGADFSAIGFSSIALTGITDETVFDEGIWADVDANSHSPYSTVNGVEYTNASNTENSQGRGGGPLIVTSYNCIAGTKETAPFEKEYKDDITPDLVFEYYKMTRQEDLVHKNKNSVCTIRPAPLRSIFGGAPNIRGQSDEQFYKITLGDTVLNTSKK